MSKKTVLRRLGVLYAQMDAAYAAAAARIGLECSGCHNNCCNGFFEHHTHVEWLYLLGGVSALPEQRRQAVLDRAAQAAAASAAMIAKGLRPEILCPLNEDGGCSLYSHRLMICRLHGVPNILSTPRGVREFPGCHRARSLAQAGADPTPMDRTPLYRQLAALELALIGPKAKTIPRVDLTIAQMLCSKPPVF